MTRMRARAWILGGLLLSGAAPAACGSNATTDFGPPDGVVGRSAPMPSTTATTTATATSSSMPADAGGSETGSSSGSGSSSGGKMQGDGGTTSCTVSWAKDVFTLFESTGSGSCGTAACHGATQLPTVTDGDAGATYANFKAYSAIDALPYIAPGDTNPAHAAMECNLVTGSCGAEAMPASPGTLSAAQKMTIATWLKCGSPQN